MQWSFKIGTVRGIAVHMHLTFLLLLGWILISHLLRGHDLGTAVTGVAFVLLLFGCVLLHEFGHALTAQADGSTLEASGSTVILRGTVRSWAERQEAERAAWRAPGVTKVENHIVIEP